jgi:hypothetical protein
MVVQAAAAHRRRSRCMRASRRLRVALFNLDRRQIDRAHRGLAQPHLTSRVPSSDAYSSAQTRDSSNRHIVWKNRPKCVYLAWSQITGLDRDRNLLTYIPRSTRGRLGERPRIDVQYGENRRQVGYSLEWLPYLELQIGIFDIHIRTLPSTAQEDTQPPQSMGTQ